MAPLPFLVLRGSNLLAEDDAGQALNTHLSLGKTKLPVDGVILFQHLRIEQMGREKSVPFVFHELARFPGKFRIPFDVPGVGGRHINQFHKASVSYFGAACTMVRVVFTAACAV